MVVMKKLAYYFASSMSQSQGERVTPGQRRGGGGGHLVLKFQRLKFDRDSKASWRCKRNRGDNPIAAILAPRTPDPQV
jgi:hypothetical protein